MKKSIDIRQELTELEAKVAAILAVAEEEKRELTAEEKQEVDSAIGTKEDGSDGQIASLKKAHATAVRREHFQSEQLKAKLSDRIPQNSLGGLSTDMTIPATARSVSKVKHYKSEAEAYAAGQFVLGYVLGNNRSRQWCEDHGVKAAMTTGDNSRGGFLVPEPLEQSIIELREEFGVFRRFSRVWPMNDGVTLVPKLAGEVTTAFVGENTPISPSDMALSQIKLEARKLASLTLISSELSDDAIIAVAELLSRSIAQSMANKEDDCGFNGDGTSAFGGIQGLESALAAGSKVTATSQATFGALTLAFFEAVKGRLKRYAGIQPAWFISSTGYYASIERLLNAVGGNNNMNLASGTPLQFLGDPVIFSQVLHSDLGSSTGKVACYYGDLAMTAYMGTRRGISIVADSSRFFDQDAVAIRSTQRFDINVHERGTATLPGSMVALVFG